MKKRVSKITMKFVFVCMSGAMSAHAATYYVPDDFITIQSAIDWSESGDTVMVRPGTYYERLTIADKAITLQSTDGPEATIIDGEGLGTVLSILWQPATAVVDGFTITNGNGGSGGGVYVIQADPTIRNSIITGNRASTGGGVYAYWGACYLSLENVTISDNIATYDGGGIYGNVSCVPVRNSDIVNNTAGGNGGGIAGVGYCGGVWAYSTVISGNIAGGYGGGLFTGYGSSACAPVVRAQTSLVVGNSAQAGGGVYSGYNGRAFILDSTVADNVADIGGGFYATEDTLAYEVTNTILWGNSSAPILPSGLRYAAVSYSDIEGGVPVAFEGNGNISADPLFADPTNGNYELSAGSPAIDSGTAVSSADIQGTPRPQGNGYDMGAYEFMGCQAVPSIEITAFGPTYIWPPNKKTVDITVLGRIILPENCTLLSSSFSLVDEYGVYSTADVLSVDVNGDFSLVTTVEASRNGSDKDGRVYTLTLLAEDEAGTAQSAPLASLVPHDQR